MEKRKIYKFEPGDHLYVKCRSSVGYLIGKHHGIYIGAGLVIHYFGRN